MPLQPSVQSLARVVTGHAHNGIKRLRMAQDTLRLRGEWVRDTVIVITCGLHNLRVTSPTTPTSRTQPLILALLPTRA